MNTTQRKVRCPQCGQEAAYHPDNKYRPFCSARCRQIDLGQWADGSYRIPIESDSIDHESVMQ